MTFSFEDHQFMARAIALAKQGHYTTSPNPRVGCVLVKNSKIIGEGYHQKAGEGHAEVNALANARKAGQNTAGATAYVTLEPCAHFGKTPPCSQALIDARVGKVIAAMVDPNPQVAGKGLAMIENAGIPTAHGLLEQDARALNTGFLTLMNTGSPYLRCKLAASLDGKTAMASGESQWITSALARQDVQRLRAQSCAIISGASSVITDNARMTVRHEELGELAASYAKDNLRQPVRVIIDGKNRITPELALFSQSSSVIIFRSKIDNEHQWPEFVEQIAVDLNGDYLDLPQIVDQLASKGFNDVLVESGEQLAGAFIEQDLINELILYQAPKLLGATGKSLVNFTEITTLSSAKQLSIKTLTQVGEDIKIIAQFVN